MAMLTRFEDPSAKSSVGEIADYFEARSSQATLIDAFRDLRVYDPGRQRSLAAAFLKDAKPGKKYHHLIGTKVLPSTTSRGRSSAVFGDLEPIAPAGLAIQRSDAFAGIRAIDRSHYSGELATTLDRVSMLNLTGRTGDEVNRLAVEYDHAVELERVKYENAKLLADERLAMVERVMEVLDRVTGGADGTESNGRRLRPRAPHKDD